MKRPAPIFDPADDFAVVRTTTASRAVAYATPEHMLLTGGSAVDVLAGSGFMREWLLRRADTYAREWITEALAHGEKFVAVDSDGTVTAEYRKATDAEVAAGKPLPLKRALAASRPAAEPEPDVEVTVREHKPRVKAGVSKDKPVREHGSGVRTMTWTFKIPAQMEGMGLPRQAIAILGIIREARLIKATTEELEAVLNAGRVKAGLAPDLPVLARFRRFYNDPKRILDAYVDGRKA